MLVSCCMVVVIIPGWSEYSVNEHVGLGGPFGFRWPTDSKSQHSGAFSSKLPRFGSRPQGLFQQAEFRMSLEVWSGFRPPGRI